LTRPALITAVRGAPETVAELPLLGHDKNTVVVRLPVYLFLAFADLGVLIGCYAFTVFGLEAYTFDLGTNVPQRMLVWCSVLALVWVPVAVNLGAYRRIAYEHPFRSGYVAAKAALIGGALFHLVPLVGGPVYSRVASLTVVLVLMLGVTAWRILASRVLAALSSPLDIIVVGADWAGRTLAEAARLGPRPQVRIVGFVDSDPARVGTQVHGLTVRPIHELRELFSRRVNTTRVVLAMPDEADATVYEHLTALAQVGVEILPMAAVYEQLTGRVPVRHLGNSWWAILPRPSEDIVYQGTKRLIDVTLGLVGLAVLTVLLPILWPLLRLETSGPLFFVQERIGWHGRPLRVAKLRTLRPATRAFTSYWERKNANEASRFGSLLRATGIDELPQCWNILKGEMSFVGPRPYVPDEVADYQRDIPFFRCRALVKPGLTGWAQVNWGYGLSLEDEVEKLQYDLYYVGHQSFYLDLLILVRTLALSLRRRRPTKRSELASVRVEQSTGI